MVITPIPIPAGEIRTMNEEPIKICASCGAEYSLEAVTCGDCGGKLVFPQEYEKLSIPLKEAEAQILIREGSVDYLRELAGLLEKNGLRSAIRFHGCTPGT
jgi:ribosomal protein L40E